MGDDVPPPVTLTRRQIDCLTLVAAGHTSAQIGMVLGLSKRTVDHYINHACARLAVRNRAQAVAKAISTGQIAAPEESA